MENGSDLTGIGQQVVDGEAHLGISPSAVLEYRAHKLDFLPSISFSK
jgi:hypothetical protein